MFAHTFKLN